jgi:hypothetical protein
LTARKQIRTGDHLKQNLDQKQIPEEGKKIKAKLKRRSETSTKSSTHQEAEDTQAASRLMSSIPR